MDKTSDDGEVERQGGDEGEGIPQSRIFHMVSSCSVVALLLSGGSNGGSGTRVEVGNRANAGTVLPPHWPIPGRPCRPGRGTRRVDSYYIEILGFSADSWAQCADGITEGHRCKVSLEHGGKVARWKSGLQLTVQWCNRPEQCIRRFGFGGSRDTAGNRKIAIPA